MINILKSGKKYIPIILLGPIVMIIEVIMEVKIPTVMSEIVDNAIPSQDTAYVSSLGVRMVLMACCSLLAGTAGQFFSSIGGVGFGSELRKAIFNKIQQFSFGNVDKFQQSSLLTRLTTDVDYIQQGLRMSMTMFIRAPFMMVAAAISAYKLSKELFFVFVVAGPVLIIIVAILAAYAMPKFKYMLTRYDALNDKEKEYLTNVRVVKAYVREDHEIEKFKEVNLDLMKSSIQSETVLSLLEPIIMLVIYSSLIAIYYYGGKQVMVGGMGIGALTAFVTYVGRVLSGLIMLAMIFLNIMRMKTSVDRISEVLSCDADIKDGDYTGEVENGTICFKNVTFRYDKASKDAIKGVDFTIRSGETVGIIGSTGCGKTSLVQLIPRLYDVNGGSVEVGGRNVKEYNLKTLRDSVAMVLQQNTLFSGTIEDNIKWGNMEATHEEVVEACKAAQADDFITSFPDGYNTNLGQGGVNVSGGQKQRLCIARALLKKPKIIILDDSTSAVDTHTDMMIREALKKELKDTTTLIIAQRVASVMDADRVLVINNGKIDAFDTPDNLLKTNEIYQDIYNTQMKGVEA